MPSGAWFWILGWVFVRRIHFGTLWVSVGCCLVVVDCCFVVLVYRCPLRFGFSFFGAGLWFVVLWFVFCCVLGFAAGTEGAVPC